MAKPKSYQTHDLRLTQVLRDKLPALASKEQGGYEIVFARINAAVRSAGAEYVTRISTADLDRLKNWSQRADEGAWQGWARDALAHNGIDPNT